MSVLSSVYSIRYNEAAGSVRSGRSGAISENRFLLDNYGKGCYEILCEGLDDGDARVRMETVLLFARLRIIKPRDRITEMSYNDRDSVAGACVAYLKALEQAEERIPELLYTANHRTGAEFRSAMRTLGDIGTAQDIPEIRKVMGQVEGEMREQTRNALSRIVDRDPDLEAKRPFILSDPVYPDEKGYAAFLEKAIDYLDVRYREKIMPRDEVKMGVYNNVVSAILRMQIRIYNERPNMYQYSEDIVRESGRLEDLVYWAAEDLKSKRIVMPEGLGRTSTIGDYR